VFKVWAFCLFSSSGHRSKCS